MPPRKEYIEEEYHNTFNLFTKISVSKLCFGQKKKKQNPSLNKHDIYSSFIEI